MNTNTVITQLEMSILLNIIKERRVFAVIILISVFYIASTVIRLCDVAMGIKIFCEVLCITLSLVIGVIATIYKKNKDENEVLTGVAKGEISRIDTRIEDMEALNDLIESYFPKSPQKAQSLTTMVKSIMRAETDGKRSWQAFLDSNESSKNTEMMDRDMLQHKFEVAGIRNIVTNYYSSALYRDEDAEGSSDIEETDNEIAEENE